MAYRHNYTKPNHVQGFTIGKGIKVIPQYQEPGPIKQIVRESAPEPANPATIATVMLRRWTPPARCATPDEKFLYTAKNRCQRKPLGFADANRVIKLLRGTK